MASFSKRRANRATALSALAAAAGLAAAQASAQAHGLPQRRAQISRADCFRDAQGVDASAPTITSTGAGASSGLQHQFAVLGATASSADTYPGRPGLADLLGFYGVGAYDAAGTRLLGSVSHGKAFVEPVTLRTITLPSVCAKTLSGSTAVRSLYEASRGSGAGLCVEATVPSGAGAALSAGPLCAATSRLNSFTGALALDLSAPSSAAGTLVVPDGVASVTLEYAHAATQTAKVSHNLAALAASLFPATSSTSAGSVRAAVTAQVPAAILEKNASGKVIRTLARSAHDTALITTVIQVVNRLAAANTRLTLGGVCSPGTAGCGPGFELTGNFF